MALFVVALCLVVIATVFLYSLYRKVKHETSLEAELAKKPYRITYQEATKLFFVERATIFPQLFHTPAFISWSETIHNPDINICHSWIAGEVAKNEPKVEVWP